MRERTVVFNGFSKAFAMTGFRLGYAMAPPEAVEAMNRIHQYSMLSAPTTAQHAAIEALDNCRDEVTDMAAQYDRRRKYVLTRFEEMGLDCFPAAGAFYAFPECPGTMPVSSPRVTSEKRGRGVSGAAFARAGRADWGVSYATGLDISRKQWTGLSHSLIDN